MKKDETINFSLIKSSTVATSLKARVKRLAAKPNMVFVALFLEQIVLFDPHIKHR